MIADYMPKDVTREERSILNAVAIDVYRIFKDPQDKFIIAMVWENGYGKEETAQALGVSYVTIYHRVNKIEKILSSKYKIPLDSTS